MSVEEVENGTVEHAGVPAYYVQEPPKRFSPRLYERFVRLNLLGLRIKKSAQNNNCLVLK